MTSTSPYPRALDPYDLDSIELTEVLMRVESQHGGRLL
jgi:hypothetical protein